MGRHVFLSVLGASILLILVGMLVSMQMEERPNLGFPWQVEAMPDGSTRVFQVHLGSTTLGEAEQAFQEAAEITLFDPRDQKPVVEAYFNDLFIGGLKAKMVASFDISDADVEAIYNRGVRISTLGSGTRKITLHADDIARIKNEKIIGLTYLPSINLEAGLIEKRFGEPNNKINDPDSGGVHWLYADQGVDIVLSDDQKEVVQYVMPANFPGLVAPLQQQAVEIPE
jgi:hypothetical protein